MDTTILEHTKNYQDLRAEVASLTVSVKLLIAQNDAKNQQANYDIPAKTSNAISITPHPTYNVEQASHLYVLLPLWTAFINQKSQALFPPLSRIKRNTPVLIITTRYIICIRTSNISRNN